MTMQHGLKSFDGSPAPNFRRALRMLLVRRLWICSALLLSASVATMKHFTEGNSFVSTAVLSLDDQGQRQVFGGVPGLTNGDNFLPKIHGLIRQFDNPETCTELVKVVGGKMTDESVDSSICGGLSFQPDFDKLQIGIVSRTGVGELSRQTAGAAAELLIGFDQLKLRRKISEMKSFLGNQETELGSQLKKIEGEKAAFQADSSVLTVNQAEKFITDRLEKADQDFLETQVLLKNNEGLLEQTRRSMVELKAALEKPDPPLSSLYLTQVQYRLSMLQYRKSTMKNQGDAEAAAKIDSEIAKLMEVYQRAVGGAGEPGAGVGSDPIEYMAGLKKSERTLLKDRELLRAKSRSLESTLAKKADELKSLVATIRRLGEMTREHEIANSLYSVVKKRLQEIEIDEAGAVSDFALLSKAHPGYPENLPFWKKLLFALGIALFGSVALIAILEAMASSIKDQSDLEKLGVNPMGYIPEVAGVARGEIPILIDQHSDSLEADAFRGLRFKLQGYRTLLVGEDKAMVVLVTSPHSNSGKSFVACNLAAAFARSGHPALLIDLDLRHPSVHQGFPRVEGRLNGVTGEQSFSSAIENQSPDLDIVCSRNPIEGAPEFLEKLNLAGCLEQVREKYQVIIIDSPPALAVIDSYLFMGAVDLQLLVVEHRRTHTEDVVQATTQLGAMRKIPLVATINRANPEIIFVDQGKYYKVISPSRRRVS